MKIKGNSLFNKLGDNTSSDDKTFKDVIKLKNPAAVSLGRMGGLKGGIARAKTLSPEERSAIARNAALARWKKN